MNFKGIDISYVDKPSIIAHLKNEIVFELSAGSKHSVFATLSDKVFACGSGLQGQLGFGTFTKQKIREH
jgi:alpha-tubulin suppressor-like RCC1 family protein